jgi:hypothetical protein
MSVAAIPAGAVRFEIPGAASSARLLRRLARRANVMLLAGQGPCNAIVAELGDEPGDLSALLREVEAWVEEESLAAIRFELDGRAYVLEAGETDWTAVPPQPVDGDIAARRARLREALDSVDLAVAELEGRGGSASRPDMEGLEGLRAEIELALRLLD